MNTDRDGMDELPYELQHSPRWGAERDRIMRDLLRDAEGLPMTTSQKMIIERMATFYAITRKREADPESKLSASDLRANNQQWLAMTAEFNRQLTVGEDDRRSALIETIMKVINNAVIMIEDPVIREGLRKDLSTGFKNAGL